MDPPFDFKNEFANGDPQIPTTPQQEYSNKKSNDDKSNETRK